MHPKRAVVLVEIEPTYGTDPTPQASVNAVRTSVPTIKPVLEQIERNITTPSLSPLAPIVIGTEVQVDFEVEACPASAAGSVPEIGPILRGCGFEETISEGVSVTYAPVSEDHEGVTIYAWRHDVRHRISGCRGTVKLVAETNKIGIWQCSFRGIYQGPTDTALPSPTYSTVDPSVVRAASLSLTPVASYSAGSGKANTIEGGSTTVTTTLAAFASVKAGYLFKSNSLERRVVSVASNGNSLVVDETIDLYNTGSGYDWEYKDSWIPVLAKIEVDMANDLQQRQDMTAATGVSGIEIAGRKPQVTLDPEVTTLADRDVWAAILAGTYYELALGFGATPGITIACPKLALSNAEYGERGARLTHSITGTPEYDSGDDEVTIIF